MKLKYYMRGLGIGIVLTTLILTIGNTKEKLSNSQIIERAASLGMTMKEDSNSNSENLPDEKDISITPASSVTPATDLTVGPTEVPTTVPTVEPTKTPTVKPTPTAKPIPTKAPTDPDKSEKMSFTIESGMSSGQVAELLEIKGIIKDADDFNQYIVLQKKASIIRVGIYSISLEASYDDIITMITTQ